MDEASIRPGEIVGCTPDWADATFNIYRPRPNALPLSARLPASGYLVPRRLAQMMAICVQSNLVTLENRRLYKPTLTWASRQIQITSQATETQSTHALELHCEECFRNAGAALLPRLVPS